MMVAKTRTRIAVKSRSGMGGRRSDLRNRVVEVGDFQRVRIPPGHYGDGPGDTSYKHDS